MLTTEKSTMAFAECSANAANGERYIHLRSGHALLRPSDYSSLYQSVFRTPGRTISATQYVFIVITNPATRASQFRPGTTRGAATSSAIVSTILAASTQRIPAWQDPGEVLISGAKRRTQTAPQEPPPPRNHRQPTNPRGHLESTSRRPTPPPLNQRLPQHHLPWRYRRIATPPLLSLLGCQGLEIRIFSLSFGLWRDCFHR